MAPAASGRFVDRRLPGWHAVDTFSREPVRIPPLPVTALSSVLRPRRVWIALLVAAWLLAPARAEAAPLPESSGAATAMTSVPRAAGPRSVCRTADGDSCSPGRRGNEFASS